MGAADEGLEVSTLADFSRVSVSTVERVERGERVSEEFLDQIAQALGYEVGAFHAPRIPLSAAKVAEDMVDAYGNLERVPVSPLKTQRAVREAMSCQAFLVHRPQVPEVYDQDITNLVEWLDFASFTLSEDVQIEREELPPRRKLYGSILACANELERRGLTVLTGVMLAPQPNMPDWKVAIISITPKLTDPGAIKRDHVFVDRRNVVLSNMEFGDIESITRKT
jgi:transcriptional regulator with XRE-family HTH domain